MTSANLRPTAYAILLLIGASSATALTLEGPRGAVVLGRPLDFAVQASLNSGEDAASLCLEADVFQADALVNPAGVNVQLLGAAGSSSATVRVTATSIVEEPILTVVLKYGCVSKNSRRYVVFADPPKAASEAASVSIRSPNLAALPDSRSTSRLPLGPSLAASETPFTAPIRRTPKPAVADASNSPRRVVPANPAKAATPRLKLDSVESTFDSVTRLKSTFELLTVPLEASSVQRTEAAALWRVLSAPAEDLRLDLQRLSALQAETLALRASSARNTAETSRLSAQLKEAESKTYQNLVVYGLLAAVALLLAILVFLRLTARKASTQSAWWNPRREREEPQDGQRSMVDAKPSSSKATIQPREPVLPAKNRLTAKTNRVESNSLPAQSRFKASESAYATLSAQGNARDVNVEELFDIQQQADFFMSLGQHDQAIDVLLNHIQENAQTSPLVYLDLLKLYHRLEKQAEYDILTAGFIKHFNVAVPPFDDFQLQTRGLEHYEATMSQIISFWQSGNVLKIIEDLVFKDSGGTTEALDLEAYRELLLLHSIAKDLAENQIEKNELSNQTTWPKLSLPANSTRSGFSALRTFNPTVPQRLTPVIDNSERVTTHSSVHSVDYPKAAGGRIGLDIDLTDAVPITEFQPQLVHPVTTTLADPAPSVNSGLIEFDLDSFEVKDKSK